MAPIFLSTATPDISDSQAAVLLLAGADPGIFDWRVQTDSENTVETFSAANYFSPKPPPPAQVSVARYNSDLTLVSLAPYRIHEFYL